ncbi:MAG: AAA family ATPase [Caldilineaceae bacterium]|nr:AAA family ATPase [Caldilineaceae bacterium]
MSVDTMKPGHIESLEIKNYRMFRHVTLKELQPVTVVIGANGTGKTTLLDIFTFLQDSLQQNVSAAVAKRGGFGQLVSRGEHGPIEITVKFRNESRQLVTYGLQIDERQGRAVVAAEQLKYRRGQRGKPWLFLDFVDGKGKAITNESAYRDDDTKAKRREYTLDDSSILAIKGLGQFEEFKVASMFRNLIEKWYVSDFHIDDARVVSDTGYAEHLSKRGDNIAQVTHFLHESHPEAFESVLEAMRRRVPGVKEVAAHATEDGRLALRFQDDSFKEPFNARFVSDGTIKMFAYLTLIYNPELHPILAIEEPENYLYPKLIPELVDEFRHYANRGGQVFITTHSPDFLNEVELKEIVCLSKEQGFTVAERPVDTKLVKALVAEGEVPGRLWKQGLLFDHKLGG